MVMPKKHRRGGVKQQHSIIPGIRRRLQKIAACPHVQAVTPGRISPAVGPQQPVILFQYFQETGMKLSGKIPGAVQEIFVVSSDKEAALNWLVAAGLVVLEENRPGKPYSQNRKNKPVAEEMRLGPEASYATIQRYVKSLSPNTGPLQVSIGERVNGQMRRLKDNLVKEAKKQPKTPLAKGKPPTKPSTISTEPTTMEEWLKAADGQDALYWQKIKSGKDS
jgi:DNA segregation ATPase FtsK/SpoIIIE-like protein